MGTFSLFQTRREKKMNKADPRRQQEISSCQLNPPHLNDIRSVLEDGLKRNYEHVEVEIVDCPDLSQAPFHLAAPGICGNARLADVGGVPYLVPGPAAWRERVYCFNQVATQVQLPGGHVLGACAGSKHAVGVNSECIPNVVTCGGVNETHCAKMNGDYPVLLSNSRDLAGCHEFTLLGNLFITEGQRNGKVIKVVVRKRTGQDGSLTTCMRNTLAEGFDRPVGLGGTFIQKSGTVKYHVMPDFATCPLNSDADVENWLTFHEFGAPFVNMATLISKDPGLDLRVEHTHGYSLQNGTGGHYHYDTTPDTIEYEGYFTPADSVWRIDAPKVTHMIGRD